MTLTAEHSVAEPVLIPAGRPQVGGWCAMGSAFALELVCSTGPDYVVVDCQHGLAGDPLHHLLQAADAMRVPTLVRLPVKDFGAVQRALDAGASGVIVPMVNDEDDARAAVLAAKYPALGERSFGPVRARLRLPVALEAANRRTLCLVQIETGEALANLSSILDVDGIDGVYVGPADLAISLGHEPGRFADGAGEELAGIAEAVRGRGKLACVHTTSPEMARVLFAAGYDACSVGTDAVWLQSAYREVLSRAVPGSPPAE